MALLGNGALAMWWNMAPATRSEFEDWHSHEHFPERMRIPGFRRGTRWMSASGDESVFVLYEVDAHETLSSEAYAAHLNAPTPWSTKLMPHHRNMMRSQCHVLASHGGAVARHALTTRFASASGRANDVRSHFALLAHAIVGRPGVVGAHVLHHEPPALALTTEQKMRGAADRVAERVFIVCGYDLSALREVVESSLGEGLTGVGVAPGYVTDLYSLSYSATPGDVA
jgi:hypothetical protein